ncbi:MAG TPA: RHS repeat-associated core domain-containing protein [Myxococcota bacterium]|nr:RHS repeat-associated core domain-containing protein [Myxococcota bacterium]HOH77281.1 RHS repeat-associated core domain-containing protein [Myxococcota bacterium]
MRKTSFAFRIICPACAIRLAPAATFFILALSPIFLGAGCGGDGGIKDARFVPCEGPAPSSSNAGFIHGKVLAAENDEPLGGAAIRIDGVEGCVSTESDGTFTFPLKDGGKFGLTATAAGRTHARRVMAVTAGHDMNVGMMFLPRRDAAISRIGPDGGVHKSAGGGLELRFPAGALDQVREVSATRFGAGRELPGRLPETSHFTMALEAVAGEGDLNAPVTITIPNDYGFPPGTNVPVGVFDEATGEWVPDGMGVISEDGTQVVYEARHFSAFDCNYPVETKADPGLNGKDPRRERDPCNRNSTSGNSIVDIRSGHLRLDFDMPVERYAGLERTVGLVFQSGAATPALWTGGAWEDGGTNPEDTEYAAIEVQVEGLLEKVYVQVAEKDNWAAHVWDGRNARGEVLPTGLYDGWIKVFNGRKGIFAQADVFGGQPTYSLGIEADEMVEADTVITTRYQLINGRDSSVGNGWYLKDIPELFLHPDGAVMVVMNGESGGIFLPDVKAVRWAGAGQENDCGDGAPRQNSCLEYPEDMVVAPDGSVLTTDDWQRRIVRIKTDGTTETVFADSGNEYDIVSIAVSPSGTTYFADGYSGKVFRLSNGGPEFVVGGDFPDIFGSAPSVSSPTDLDFDAEGNLFIADWPLGLRKLDPNGVLSNVYEGDNPDWPAPVAIDVTDDGSILLAEPMRHRVRRLTADGRIEPVAGIDGEQDFRGDGYLAVKARLDTPSAVVQGPQGTIYITDEGNDRIRAVTPDGIIRTFAGKGSVSGAGWGDGGPATDTLLTEPDSLAIDADGNVLLLDHMNGWIWKYDLSTMVYSRPPSQSDVLSRVDADGDFVLRHDDTDFTFDAAGQLTSMVGPDSDKATFTRDEAGRITDVSWQSGSKLTFEWSADGLRAIHAPGSRTLTVESDADGNITGLTMPDGAKTALSYDDDGRLNGWTDAEGRTAEYGLDTYGRVASVKAADGSVRTYRPVETTALINDLIREGAGVSPEDPAPAIVMPAAEYTDGSGKTWKYKYDALGEAVEIENPDGLVVQMGNHSCGMPSMFSIPGDYAWTAFYDEQGRILVQNGPQGETSYRWDEESGELESITTPAGRGVSFEYDDDARMTAITVDGIRIHSYAYESGLRLKSIEDAIGRTTEYRYDDKGNLFKVIQSSIPVATFERNEIGEITAITDAIGGRTEFGLDPMGRVVSVKDRAGAFHSIGLDAMGQVISLKSAGQGLDDEKMTTWSRDGKGRIQSVSLLGAPEWTINSDGEDRVMSIASPGGSVAVTYDGMGRVVSRTIVTTNQAVPDTTAIFEYDADGHLVRAVDDDSEITWEYEPRYGNLLSVTQFYQGMAEPITIGYDQDEDGWINAVEYPALDGFDGGRFDYYYHEPSQRVEEITAPDGMYFDLYRDDAGRLETFEIDWGDPFLLEAAYDETGYLASITAYLDSYREDVHMNFEYVTDDDGAIMSETGPSGTTAFGYDQLRRVTGATNQAAGRDETFDYNARGDRVGAGFEYDDFGRAIAGAGFTFEFDEAGRVTRRVETATGNAVEFLYDGDDNLVRASVYSGGSMTPEHVVTYGYDPLGKRIFRDVDGVRTFFIHDFTDVVLEINETGGADAFYLHEPAMDRPIAMYRDGEVYACIQDGFGSIRGLVRLSDRSLVWTREYGVFGDILDQTGTIPFRYGFHGREHDPLTGLIHFRAREFDPAVGRFVSTDPEKFTSFAGTYAFPGNDPVNRHDPTGAGPRAVRAAGEVYSYYNKTKQHIEQSIDSRVSSVAGRDAGAASSFAWKTAGAGMLDSGVKILLPSPYQSPGPSVTDAAVWAYKAYKAKDPCARAAVGGDVLVDIMPAGDKWLRPMVDKFNNFGNLMNTGN